jgi:methyl halide transferase
MLFSKINACCFVNLLKINHKKMKELDENYWSERYEKQQTGWDLGTVSPPLKTYIDQLKDKKQAILIPGCGNAHEVGYLLENNFENISSIDISENPINFIKNKYSEYIENSIFKIHHQDFFQHSGTYDLILEQTFFCAIDVSLRANYAKKMAELLRPKGRLVGVLFNCTFNGGPPFGGSKEEYLSYFESYFDVHTFHPCTNSVSVRNELFINLIKK